MNEQALFTAALERATADERAAFLDQACRDPELRSRVEHLLDLHSRAAGFLDEPAVDDAFDQPGPFDGVGQVIGPYKLLEQIGEGGMGVVYMAAQQQPVRRKVALKIIKPGMDTKQVIARFEAERQALALMDHSNIAHVLEAGATDSGRPYFVMELVRGVPITEYCQREELDVRERLALFVDVCHAVQHAHLKGIIHRDIKPSNVMVTLHDGKPVVKMIDFGVAKATNQQLTDRTLFTNYAQIIGTPLYMSPEQAEMSGLDVDTRSDIYSLGVLLYELLTNTTPFEESRLKEVGYDEMRRIIREEEPPKPSARVSTMSAALETVSDQRRVEQRRDSRMLCGELDWIVIRALDKQRGRRYQSAREFADDVERFLNGEQVAACPPSISYRIKKLLGKHRGTAAAAAAVTLLLVLATTISTTFAIRAGRAKRDAAAARESAEVEASIAKAFSDFLSKELLGQASPYENPNRDLSLREVLDRASERIDGHFDGKPLVEASIRATLGNTYLHLGEYEASMRHLRRAHNIQLEQLGAKDRQTLQSAFQMAIIQMYTVGSEAAAESWEETLEVQRSALGDTDRDTLVTKGWLAYCYALQKRFDDAEPLFAEANDSFHANYGPRDRDTLDCLDGLARMYQFQGRYEEAEELIERLLETRRQVVGVDHPQYLSSLSALAAVKLARGRTDDALELYRRALEARKLVLGARHPTTLIDARDLAETLHKMREYDSAEELYRDTLAAQKSRYGDDDERTLWTMSALVHVYIARGQYDEAEPLLQAALASRRRTLRDDNEVTIRLIGQLAGLHTLQGRFEAAIKLRNEVIEARTRLHGKASRQVDRARLDLAHTLQEAGNFQKAADLVRYVIQQQVDESGPNADETLRTRLRLGFILKKHDKLPEAEQVFREVWVAAPDRLGPLHPDTLRAGNQLATVLRYQGRAAEAETTCRAVLAGRLKAFGESKVDTIFSVKELGLICVDLKRYDEAESWFRRALRIRRKISGDNHPAALAGVRQLLDLADVQQVAGRDAEAGRLRLDMESLLEEMTCVGKAESRRLEVLADVKAGLGKPNEALAIYEAAASSADGQDFDVDATQVLADFCIAQQRFDKARDALTRLLSWRRKRHSADDVRTIATSLQLAAVAQSLNRLDEAEHLASDAFQRRMRLKGADNAATLQAQMQLAFVLKLRSKLKNAEAHFRQVWEQAPAAWGPNHLETLRAGNELAELLGRRGRHREALTLCRSVLETRRKALDANHIDIVGSLQTQALLCRLQDQLSDAAGALLEIARISVAEDGSTSPEAENALLELGKLGAHYERRGEWREQADLLERIYPVLRDVWGENSKRTIECLGLLARAYGRLEDWPQVYAARERELAARRAADKKPPCQCMRQTAEALLKLGRFDDAERLLRECLESWEATDPENPLKFYAYLSLGETLVKRKQREEAERMLMRCEKAWSDQENRNLPARRRLHRQIVELYRSWGRDEEAKLWAERLEALE